MLLASNHFTPVLGVDIHFTVMGNPFHPYIGIVIDPFDYIPYIGSTVHVNGIKRANSTTQGVIIPLFHFALFGGLFVKAIPPAPIRMGESMNFFGSQNVYTEGARFTPKGFFVMTCNDIGIPLSLAPGKSWKSLIPSLFMPLTGSLPISFGPPVNVGPPYVPDFKAMLMDLAMSMGFGYLLKYGGKLVQKGIAKLNNKFLKPGKLKNFLCKFGFEPINLINGSVVYEGNDFEIPSPNSVQWKRSWYSDSEYNGWLGYGVHCNYDRSVEIDYDLDVVGLRLEDGRMAVFSPIDVGRKCIST